MNDQIRLPALHTGQRGVLKQARRFNWLCCGRRWRKTSLALVLSVMAAATERKQAIWGSPVYSISRIAFDEARKGCMGAADFNQARMEAVFPNGGRIMFRSLDRPDNVRGLTGDLVVIDEAPYCNPESWHSVLRPTLIDTGGDAWLIGTPNGQNWAWFIFDKIIFTIRCGLEIHI